MNRFIGYVLGFGLLTALVLATAVVLAVGGMALTWMLS